MFYTYESGGRVSRPISDYRSEVLSGSFAARGLESFKFNQGPAVPLSDISGTLAYYADRSIYNLSSQRSGLGVLSGAQTAQQDVPPGWVGHQPGPIYSWTTDEFGGNADANRIFQPAPSRILFLNNAEETKSYSYHPAVIDLYTEVDFGSITDNAGNNTSNNGLVTDLNATLVDYGRVVYVTTVESFGFSKTLNEASWKATSAWVGSGRLISFGKQTSPAVYGTITDGKVKGLSGTADVDYSPATYGRGILPLQGNSVIGIAAAIEGFGSLRKFSGSSESLTVNPDETQMLFSFTGERIERTSNTHIGSGRIRNLATLKAEKVIFDYVGSGEITIRSNKSNQYKLEDIADWILEDIKGRPLASIKYEPADEKHTEDYNESAVVRFTERDYGLLATCSVEEIVVGDISGQGTGCITKVEIGTTARVVSGQTYQPGLPSNTATNFVDWGSITDIASMREDGGWILNHTDLIPFGGLKIDPHNGCADKFLPSWTSRGYISKLSGVAQVPLDVGVRGSGGFRFLGASKTNFALLQPGDGLFGFHSESSVAVGLGVIGDGRFSTFSGGAESATFNPTETQMLFSFTGEYKDLRFTFGTYHGDGRLFNVSGGEERGTNSYVGSGKIKIRPDKPEQLNLKKLADTLLSSIRGRRLSSLSWELSDEKHTEDYNFSSFVPSVDIDYGFIVDPSLVSCINVPMVWDITTNTTATTGCTKVPGTLSVSATYSIPINTTTPTSYTDLGSVSTIASPSNDYGWILGTHAHGIPFGTVADITGNAAAPRVFNEVSEGGLIKITGKALLPLFASVFGTGLFKPAGASKTNFSLLAPGDGHINGMSGAATYSFHVEHHGDGRFSTFSGGAESATFNPTEKQMLFSFTGGYTDLKFTHGTWHGSGRIKNFATLRAEKTSYDWIGSGTILTWNKLEEARTYWYNCSSIVPFLDLDYGYLVDPSTVPVTSLTTQTIFDATAPTGNVRVEQGEVVTLDGTYSVPIQTTSPTEFIDYNILLETEDQLLDLGHILDTAAMGLPSCVYGEIDITGSAASIFQPNWVGRGGIRLDNAGHTNFSLRHIGSGTIRKAGGSAITSAVAVESTGLFKIDGTSSYAAGIGVIGDGRFSTFSGASESITLNPLEKQMLFSFIGTSEPYKLTYSEFSSGTIKSLSGGYITETESYVGSGTITLRSRKPKLSEPSDEKHTEVYDLGVCYDPEELDYGFLVDPSTVSITPLTTQTITSDVTAPTGNVRVEQGEVVTLGGTYSVPIQTTVPTEFWDNYLVAETEDGLWDYGWILDDTGKDCPFGQIGRIYGEALSAEVNVYTCVSPGESEWKVHGINIAGDAFIFVPPAWNSPGDPPIDVTGNAKPNFSLLHPGSGHMFSMGGGAESARYVPPTEDVLFRFVPGPFDRWTTYDWQPSWVSKGGITIRPEEAKTHWVPHIIGTGSFKKLSGASESVTFNPEERQMLFSFIGEGTWKSSVSEEGDGKLFTLRRGPLSDWDTYDWQPCWNVFGTIPVTGEGKTHYVPHVVGSGTFKKFAGAAESITFNPLEKQMLFSFIGTREAEKTSVAETGLGIIQLTGAVTSSSTRSEIGSGNITLTGVADTDRTRVFVGTGTFRKIGGSAEAITFNPEERQMLFSFAGAGSQSTVAVPPEGDGRLFGFGGASITTRSAYETQGLYKVSGESRIGFSLSEFGSGYIPVFNGAAESLTVNPDERQLLFSFTGAGSESTSVAEIKQVEVDITGKADPVLRTLAFHGSGTISVSGEAKTHWVPSWVGSGTLRKFNGVAESLTVNPEERQMLFSFVGTREAERILVREVSQGGTITFSGTSGDPLLTFAEQPYVQTKISGEVYFTTHRSIYGSGSLYSFSGAAEAIAIVPEPSTILFQTYGESDLRVTRSYIGSGTLRKISGAAESVTFNPDEQQMLFSFTGAGTQSKTAREIGTGTLTTTGEAGVLLRFAHTGEGTISLSGDAHTTRARDYVGFGTIPVLTGAAESISFNPEEKQLLFSFHGKRISEKITARELSQGGTLVVGSTSGDPLLTFAEQPYVRLDITGDSYDIRTRAYQGSGRISNVNNLDEAFARTPYIGSGVATITGNAFVQVQLFQPAHVQVWII